MPAIAMKLAPATTFDATATDGELINKSGAGKSAAAEIPAKAR